MSCDMEEREKEIFERITAAESSVRSLHKRVDRHDALIESIQNMTTEIKHMREDVTETSKSVEAVTKRVAEIESKPAKRWESIVGTILTTIVAALAGGLVGILLGGG